MTGIHTICTAACSTVFHRSWELFNRRAHKLVLCLQLKLMTSWAVVCDVYFLEPQTKGPDETSQQFAERVQKLIAQRANLHIAPWDGYLKYYNLGDKVSCSATHFVSARKV